MDNNFTSVFDNFKKLKVVVPETSSVVNEFYENIENIPLDQVKWDMFYEGCEFADESFVKFVNDVDVSERTLENYQKYLQESASSTTKFSSALKSIGANVLIMLALNWAIKVIAWALDELNVTVEEQLL